MEALESESRFSIVERLLVVAMASLKLGAADAWLTGLKLSLLRGDSKPESILLSELLELSGRLLRGSSIAALNDHGLTLIDNSHGPG